MRTATLFISVTAVVLVGFLAIAPPVFAVPTTFTIVPGQTFPDGNSISGTLAFNFDSNLIESFDFLTGPITAHSDAGDIVLPSIEYSSSFPFDVILGNVYPQGLTVEDLLISSLNSA